MNSESNPRLLKVFERKVVTPPPIWLMRQAGRYHPEYQEMRKRAGSFWTMCMTPELSVEVTLQPIRRFDFDAAIIFSDILVIPHALGQSVRFEDGVGPIIEPFLEINALIRDKEIWREKLSPVYLALKNTRKVLAAEKTLIGFSGAPWTLAAYMLEGRGTKDQGGARLYAYRNQKIFGELLELLSEAVATHLIWQIEAGANVVQIFDSWAGGLPEQAFKDWVIAPTKRAIAMLRRKHPHVPIIGFPRQATQSGLETYAAETGVNAISIDTATSIGWAVEKLGGKFVLQGNLDPLALVAGGEILDRAIDKIMAVTAGVPFIFNLGHGILQTTPTDNVARLVACVRGRSGE